MDKMGKRFLKNFTSFKYETIKTFTKYLYKYRFISMLLK